MKNRTGEKVKLASLDELLGVVNEESAMEIEISKIHAFNNHPFNVLDLKQMDFSLYALPNDISPAFYLHVLLFPAVKSLFFLN